MTLNPMIHYTWYRSGDNANDTPGDDTAVGTDANTLTVINAATDQEGYYYCVASNSGGAAVSNVVKLGVKRLVAFIHR